MSDPSTNESVLTAQVIFASQWTMPNVGTGRVAQFGIFLLLLTAHVTGLAQNGFEWVDASGETCNLSDLEGILQRHREWLESERENGIQADLSGADLHGAKLHGVRLRDAKLSGTNLSDADLSGADLVDAKLIETDLHGANLHNAFLSGADLSRSSLNDTDLSEAKLLRADFTDAFVNRANLSFALLAGANLSGASLGEANLYHAGLIDTDLSGTLTYGSDLRQAVFEPKSLPQSQAMAGAENLELLTYDTNPEALVQLRKEFEKGGFRDQERKITYALKRREAELCCEKCTLRKMPGDVARPTVSSSDSILANCGSFVLNKVFFDWTCQYGMSPGRPLMVGLLLWFVCSLLYFGFIHTPGHAGLYRIYRQSVAEGAKPGKRVERILPPRRRHRRGSQWLLYLLWRECLLLRTSMFFSLMSAFNIGFRDINFGRWLRLLTRQEFDIKAVGWARVVAGWQSLFSVYLLALWVLTYFGRPFE
jgi:uncharacterized protein YjbI with pentapeptide repeats